MTIEDLNAMVIAMTSEIAALKARVAMLEGAEVEAGEYYSEAADQALVLSLSRR